MFLLPSTHLSIKINITSFATVPDYAVGCMKNVITTRCVLFLFLPKPIAKKAWILKIIILVLKDQKSSVSILSILG